MGGVFQGRNEEDRFTTNGVMTAGSGTVKERTVVAHYFGRLAGSFQSFLGQAVWGGRLLVGREEGATEVRARDGFIKRPEDRQKKEH